MIRFCGFKRTSKLVSCNFSIKHYLDSRSTEQMDQNITFVTTLPYRRCSCTTSGQTKHIWRSCVHLSFRSDFFFSRRYSLVFFLSLVKVLRFTVTKQTYSYIAMTDRKTDDCRFLLVMCWHVGVFVCFFFFVLFLFQTIRDRMFRFLQRLMVL